MVKKKEDGRPVPSAEQDKETAAREHIRREWIDKDPDIVPEQCKTGRCWHKEHRIISDKGD